MIRSLNWLPLVIERHTRALSKPEFLKAVRALSARYVERRSDLARRSPTDSAGKRAAFAGFFAPLHFLTVRAIVSALGTGTPDLGTIVDLGCGTGPASAAWAGACETAPEVLGIDRQDWVLDEASWNWRVLGLKGRTRRGDLVREASRLARSASGSTGRGVVLAWSVNELADAARGELLPALLAVAARSPVLIVEPLSRAAAPWWDEWSRAWRQAGGRADEWKFDIDLPAALADLSGAAGFRREWLGARALSRGLGA